METSYAEKANRFANKLGLKLTVKGVEYKDHFKEGVKRHTFRLKLSRGRRSYTFDFGQSIAKGNEEPTMYDVLACLCKDDPEDFQSFCDNYGYEFDNENKRVYNAVVKEFEAVQRLFDYDEIELLKEII